MSPGSWTPATGLPGTRAVRSTAVTRSREARWRYVGPAKSFAVACSHQVTTTGGGCPCLFGQAVWASEGPSVEASVVSAPAYP
jgi:hypothetical protein